MDFYSNTMLRTLDFRSDAEAISSFKDGEIININRDFAYHLRKNHDGSFAFDLTVYIIYQLQETHKLLIGYVGLEKWLVYNDGASKEEDLKELTKRVTTTYNAAWYYTCQKEPALKAKLSSNVKADELCQRIHASLIDIDFYD